MAKLVVNSFEEFAAHKGERIGESDWVTVSQDMIDKFADATLDHQWIHTDPERCSKESPYHQTIAHGYLQLSLLPYLWQQLIQVNNVEMLVNYGMDKMKFGQPCQACCRPLRRGRPSRHLQGTDKVPAYD